MPRSPIIVPRSGLILPRQRVVPVGLRGFGSLWLDGVDDRVTNGSSPVTGSNPWTIATWMRTTSDFPGFRCAVGIGDSTGIYTRVYVGTNSTISLMLAGVFNLSSNVYPSVCQWYRVVATFTGGTGRMRLYVDGTLTATSATVTPSIGAESSRIGYGFSAIPIHGNVWDARIYSRAWTPREVAADFAGEWVDPTGLARWWTCENPGSGPTCREEIGGTNDPITGALWSPNVPMRQRRVIESARSVA